MTLKGLRIGICITGSFCTFEKIAQEVEKLAAEGMALTPIFSYNAQSKITRFGDARVFVERIAKITGNKPILTIEDAEPIGPSSCFDALLIAPCTGNTLAKLSAGITDTPVLMAAKAHLRNLKPLVLSLSTNDALSTNFRNVGALLNTKNIYFVPFGQDDYRAKPNSLISHTDLIAPALEYALQGKQFQPILV